MTNLLEKTGPIRWKIELAIRAFIIYVKAFSALTLPKFFRESVSRNRAAGNVRHVLIVSYFFPPYKSRLGTQRVEKFSKYLKRFGWRVSVLTTNPIKDSDFDRVCEPQCDGVEVIRIDALPDHMYSYKNLIPPDDYLYWVPQAEKELRKFIRSHDVAVVLATAPPYSNLVAAAMACARSGIPLVCDFRDPWTKIDVVWVLRRKFLVFASELLERAVLKVAKKIVVADEIRYLDEFFPSTSFSLSEKAVSIRNGYDEEDFHAISPEHCLINDGKFVISYVGGFYSIENFSCLMAPILQWIESYPMDISNIRIEYAGSEGDYFMSLRNSGIEVVDHGYVNHERAIVLRHRCNVQLFGQPATFKAHVLSGKIYEMIRVPRPILAMTNPDGAVSRLIRESNTGVVVSVADVDQASKALKKWFDEFKSNGSIAYEPNTTAIANYSRERQAELLSETLDELFIKDVT